MQKKDLRLFIRRGRFLIFLIENAIKKLTLRDSMPFDVLLNGQIMVDTEKMITLLWTPKVGSIFAVRWFFEQIGILDKALLHHQFVHVYRDDVYRYSEYHRKSLNTFLNDPDKYSVIKIVRHPLKRAVSSFIHANKRGYSDKKISKILRRKITSNQRFSFREFVEYLEKIDIYKCNVHYRLQTHPYEIEGKLTVNYVIDLDNSIKQLGNLEKKLNLKPTNLFQLSKSKHHTTRVNVKGFHGDTIDFFGRKNIEIPDSKNFYDDNLVKRIGSIYAEDFERYNYQCSLDDI